MTMEERHPANYRIGKIHHQIHRAAIGDIHGIDPYWIFHWIFADAINQEMDLMDVKRMDFSGWVHDPPVVERTDIDCQHGAGIHFEFLPIYIEALFIFREVDNELRVAGFDAFENSRRKGCIDWRSAERRPGLKIRWWRRNDIGQDHCWIRISIRSAIETACAQRSMQIRPWSGNNCFHSPGRWNQNVAH